MTTAFIKDERAFTSYFLICWAIGPQTLILTQKVILRRQQLEMNSYDHALPLTHIWIFCKLTVSYYKHCIDHISATATKTKQKLLTLGINQKIEQKHVHYKAYQSRCLKCYTAVANSKFNK